MRSGKHGRRPRRPSISAEQFQRLREFTGKSREDVADLVGVSLRTVGHWETGKARPTYAAFRLLRAILRGEVLAEGWEQYAFIRGRLVTPEGRSFGPGDLSWLSLLVQRANYRSLVWAAARLGSCSSGLVPSKTSSTGAGAEQAKSRACAVAVGPKQGHNGPTLALTDSHAQAQSEAPRGFGRGGAAGSRRAARIPEHVHPAGDRQLHPVHPRASGTAAGQSISGACGTCERRGDGRPASGASRAGGARSVSDGRTRARGAQGRAQAALPVRKRQALRKVPRAGVTPVGGAA